MTEAINDTEVNGKARKKERKKEKKTKKNVPSMTIFRYQRFSVKKKKYHVTRDICLFISVTKTLT